ncbi:hypothetical protein ID866_4830 [Astraeus odoratus]|nr:hypothetical protein ID866_4830 [Astraeus odoratus]
MFNTLLSLLSVFLLAFSYMTNAAPVQPVELLVFSPNITSPNGQTVWFTGSKQNVTWETDNIPDEKKNSTGLLLLGHQTNNSENLDIHNPLATQFPISLGYVEITVPQGLENRTDYIVVLFGDSGNACPEFTIINNDPVQN